MTTPTPAVILAGGAGRRLGRGEKARISLGGFTLFDRVRRSLAGQSLPLAISTRTQTPWSSSLGLPVLEDLPSPDRGPLGGIAAALVWASSLTPKPAWVITTPVDVPFLPDDLCNRLTSGNGDVAVAASGGQTHHAIAAWRPALAAQLLSAIKLQAIPIHRFQASVRITEIQWPVSDFDPFLNINTPEDLRAAEHTLKQVCEGNTHALGTEGA